MTSVESGEILVAFSNLNKMISSTKVNFGEELCVVEVCKKVRHWRNGVSILVAYCIQVPVIHAESKSSVLLGNKN